MSTHRKAEFVEEEVSEQSIHDYLSANPDFFERHPKLLKSLQLPHASGEAVSLVERQVSMLRQKEIKLERQLKELIHVARDNDVLAAKIHQLCLQLLAAADLQGCVSAVEEAMRAGFGAAQNRLETSIRNIGMTVENLSAANSRIRDVDVAQEMSNMTSYQILRRTIFSGMTFGEAATFDIGWY